MTVIKTTGAIVLAALLASLVFGFEKVRTHLKTGRAQLQDAVDRNSPDAHEAARIRVMLSEFDEKVREHEDKVAGADQTALEMRRQVDSLERTIGEHREILQRRKQQLAENRQRYEIGGRFYTRAEVEADALQRLDALKQAENDVQQVKEQLAVLQAAVRDGKKISADLRGERQKQIHRLAALEARLKNAEQVRAVMEMANNLRQTPLRPETELGRAMKSYEERVLRVERRNRASMGDSSGRGFIINEDSSAGASAMESIDRYFSQLASQPAPAVSIPE